MNPYKNMAIHYKRRCQELGLSDKDVAEHSEQTLHMVRKLASGEVVRFSAAFLISEVLGMNIDEFVRVPENLTPEEEDLLRKKD